MESLASLTPELPVPHSTFEYKLIPLLVGLVLILAAVLRLTDLRDKPRWYNDELFHLKVTQDLLDGELRIRAVSWTCFSPFHPYPIGFQFLGVIFAWIFGDDIWTMRFLCGIIGVGTTFFMFLAGRALFDPQAGLIAAVVYAIHPKVVLFTRWAFPQNISPLFVVGAIWCAVRYHQTLKTGWLISLSLFVGGALISIYWTGPLLFILAGIVLLCEPRKTPLALALALCPLAIQTIFVAMSHGIDPILYDLGHLFRSRVMEIDNPSGGLGPLFIKTALGYYHLLLKDPFFFIGILGLFWLPFRWYSVVLLASLAALSLPPIAQRGPLIADFFYSAVFFVPIPLLGFGLLFGRLLHVGKNIRDLASSSILRFAGMTLVLGAIGFGWFSSFNQTFVQGPNGLQTRLDAHGFTIANHKDTEDVARYINHRTSPEDFVVTTPNLPWLLHCKATGLQQMASRLPGGTLWYPPKLPENRYLYDVSYEKARFLVLDNLTYHFYITVRNCDEVLYKIHSERWPQIKQIGEFRIYANPRFPGQTTNLSHLPVLPARLQFQLAELHENRKHVKEAAKWYVRSVLEGGNPIKEKLIKMLADKPSRTSVQRALEQLKSLQATSF